ncbi:MAG: hypothetical protein IJV14_01665 [Lachnospiraceae bacterium]|nr:hypothetical protein [Lachnospiraceae bacterium]
MAKILAFAAALLLVLRSVTFPLWLKDEGYSSEVFRSFYALPKESIDYAYIGSSAAREYFSQPEAFHALGGAGYALATSNQPFIAAKYLIEEIEKTQSPKVYLIEIRELTNTGAIREGDVRKVTDSMHLTSTRSKAVNALLENLQYENPEMEINKWDYYLSLSTYHTRYKELTEGDFTEPEDLPVWSGFDVNAYIEPYEYYGMGDAAPEPLTGYRETSLYQVLEYCSTLDAKVIFTCTPALYDFQPPKAGRVKYIQQIIESAGYEFWNMNEPAVLQEIGLDLSHDMKNDMHVNVYGAFKVTDYIVRRLQSEYGIPDRRGDSRYDFWLQEYDEMMQEVARQEAEFAAQAAAAADAAEEGNAGE